MKKHSLLVAALSIVGMLYSIAVYTQSLYLTSLVDEISEFSSSPSGEIKELVKYSGNAMDVSKAIHINSMILGCCFLFILAAEIVHLVRRTRRSKDSFQS